ncbi:hypothetical protein OG756_08585 [Streptomyces sp. NBC_01310]|uniref:hypothetical protein n=1 Tax=Streptomyces sp. NBC_01310 TaxID=2903820 RepID=UPI0035B5D958|nr:hypothetical protein OG756_08585 [Streptomyces sp. NBC_01310]
MRLTRHRSRPKALALPATAIALVAMATAGFLWDSGDLVLVARVNDYVALLGWLILIALTGAVLLGVTRPVLRLVLCALLLGPGIPIMLFVTLLASIGTTEETKNEAAPGRATAGWSWWRARPSPTRSGPSMSTRGPGPWSAAGSSASSTATSPH